jgi:hypothetical protein
LCKPYLVSVAVDYKRFVPDGEELSTIPARLECVFYIALKIAIVGLNVEKYLSFLRKQKSRDMDPGSSPG